MIKHDAAEQVDRGGMRRRDDEAQKQGMFRRPTGADQISRDQRFAVARFESVKGAERGGDEQGK